MKKLIFILLFSVLFDLEYKAQDLNNFFDVTWDANQETVKILFPDISFSSKEINDLKEIYFECSNDSLLVKVAFFFTRDGSLTAASINNLGKDSYSGMKFYLFFKSLAVKKFGDNFKEQKILGDVKVLTWELRENTFLMLSHKDNKATITLTRKEKSQKKKY